MLCEVLKFVVLGVIVGAGSTVSDRAAAQQSDLECKLTFTLKEWSAIYKHAEGSGEVTCKNGATQKVTIAAVGAGVTIGQFKIDNGKGRFTDVHDIKDVLGSYVSGQADVGMVKSRSIQVLSKGPVSLTLAGTGEGMALGVDWSAFTIAAAK